MSGRTFLVGLDGATFDVLEPLMRDGVMPALAKLGRQGVRAPLRTIVPALTPPAWTSLVTGRSPGHHGIFDFFAKDDPDSHYFHISNGHDVSAETIWSMASRNGLRATVLNFPLTFPMPPIEGNVVPGWMPWRQLRLGCKPEGLFDRIKKLPGFEAKELSMDLSPEAKAVQGCAPEELETWVQFYIRRERQWLRIVEMLEDGDPAELTAVLFDGVDKIQHLCWRFIDPAYLREDASEWERRIRELCLDYFRRLDEVLARIFAMASDEDTILMASDHGFGAQTGTFFVNAWLESKGYLKWAEDAPEATSSEDLGIEQLARHVYLLDWNETKAYAPTPSANGIHIVRAKESSAPGVPEAEYEAFRAKLLRELREVEDGAGRPLVSRIWTRDEVFSGPKKELAPDVTLELRDGGLVSILDSDEVFRPRTEPLGAHRPEGVFFGRGPGLRKGVVLPELSILDVAPTVLHSLGLAVPEDLEGQVPEEAFEPDWRREKRVVKERATVAPAVAGATSGRAKASLSREEENKLAAHLRALGYIE